jgi:hypothetical protein
MPTWRTVQRIARTLPETTEGPQYDKSSFRVGGKAFLIGGNDQTFSIITDEREALLRSSPDVYESIPHHVGTNWVVVRLAHISEAELCEIMTDAWRIRAPKRLIKANPGV